MLSKNDRQESAGVRQEKRDKRSPLQQLIVLDKRLGKGQGATKERAKLLALLTDKERREYE